MPMPEPRDANGWVGRGMELRAGQQFAAAEAAYRRALQLDPANRIAYHNLGALLSQQERADEALAALEQARARGLQAGSLYINLGRTLMQLYRPEEAERAYEHAVRLEPGSPQAQASLASLRHMRGDLLFGRDFAHAVAAAPGNTVLQLSYADLLRRAGELEASEGILQRMLAGANPPVAARTALATVWRESGRLKQAEALLLELATASPGDVGIIESLVATQLTLERPGEALPFIRLQRTRAPLDQRWLAYEASAARLLEPEVYQTLHDYGRLVRAYDIQAPAPWTSVVELNAAVARALASRHLFANHPLDQSLRNGTQTARSLLTDGDEAIQALLRAFEAPIADYRAAIGQDARHPLTARNQGAAALRGCWSVALRHGGFHVNHIHPEGWLSSAYYVSVPPEVGDQSQRSGWLKFGEPRWPSPGARPDHFVQPAPGRLVLFPSYMWHGTNALRGGDARLTVAFDVVPA